MQKRKISNQKLCTITIALLLMSMMSCSQYKSSWSCKVDQGLGCTSVAYADELARKEIILNDSRTREATKHENKVLITRHYADLEFKPETEIMLEH